MARQLLRYHPTIGHQFIPGLKARVDHEGGGYLLRTNQAGFRCRHEFTRGKTPDTTRVLLFGNSYTAGDGVSDKDRYGDLLETLLPGIEVFNFALSGSGTDQQYLIWREYGMELEHDLVVIGVLVENIRRVVARFRPYRTQTGEELVLAKPYFALEDDGSLSLHHVPVPRHPVSSVTLESKDTAAIDHGGRLPRLRSAIDRLGPGIKDGIQRLTRYQPLPGYERADHPDWRLLEAILHMWTAEVDVPVVLCPIPLYQHVEGTTSPAGYRARFQSLNEPPRVIVHDPLPDFRAHSPEDRRAFRFERDCHLTPAAHRVLAESLARCIEPLTKRAAE